MVSNDARILLNADSTVLEASDAALELLGLTLEELRALPPGGLSLAEDKASSAEFGVAWDQGGRGDIVGSGTARLLDGRLIRVRYLVAPLADGTFEVRLDRSDESVAEPARIFTLGGVLSAWRAAERRLATLSPESKEWTAARAEIDHFRSEYRRVLRTKAE